MNNVESIHDYRWNVVSILLIVTGLLVSHFLIPDAGIRFLSYLVWFTLWMVWFMLTSVKYLRDDE
ncbi:MAG: hypothetical protein SXQ77_05915 [Halobacteria archaeon]|nr:hypothetical protein [Halobacteria archaeon]